MSNYNDEATLGTCLNLWSKYLESEKQMLLRRTALLLAYENANRTLDKVKGPKRDEVSLLECVCMSIGLFSLSSQLALHWLHLFPASLNDECQPISCCILHPWEWVCVARPVAWFAVHAYTLSDLLAWVGRRPLFPILLWSGESVSRKGQC